MIAAAHGAHPWVGVATVLVLVYGMAGSGALWHVRQHAQAPENPQKP